MLFKRTKVSKKRPHLTIPKVNYRKLYKQLKPLKTKMRAGTVYPSILSNQGSTKAKLSTVIALTLSAIIVMSTPFIGVNALSRQAAYALEGAVTDFNEPAPDLEEIQVTTSVAIAAEHIPSRPRAEFGNLMFLGPEPGDELSFTDSLYWEPVPMYYEKDFSGYEEYIPEENYEHDAEYVEGGEEYEVYEPVVQHIPQPIIPIDNYLANSVIETEFGTLVMYNLPSHYYGDHFDYSSFMPFMCYRAITNRSSGAWSISRSENAYTDHQSLRRYPTDPESMFTVNGQSDFIVALGTYYSPRGAVGCRFLIVTTTGMFTVIVGDEQADHHTDEMNMFHIGGSDRRSARLIEFVVQQNTLPSDIRRSGSATSSTHEAICGEILYIYRINDAI